MIYKLKDLFELQMGKTPSRHNADYWGGNNKWISIADIGNANKYIENTKECISDKAVAESGIKKVPKGTVIMSFKLSIGKTTITTEDMFTNEAIMAFIDKGICPIDTNYLYHFCCGKDWLAGTNKAVMGLTLNKATLSEIKISVPNIEIQREIALKLDKIDELIGMRRKELDMLIQLVKSRFIEMFGEINAPSKWEKKPWAELVTIQNGRDYKHIAVESGGYAVYGTGGEMARASDYLCPENTIIVGRKGTINNPLLVKEKFWNVDTAFGVIVGEQLHYQYFYGFCRMFDFSTLNKQAVLPSTTKADLLKIQIAVPPIELQEQFAAFVEQVDKSKFYIQQIDEIYLLIIKTLSWRVKHDYN